VSNFSLVLGMAGAGSSPQVVLLAGLAGLLAGALSMAAGEYVSVRSQRELLAAASQELDGPALRALAGLEAEELGLVFRARGMAVDQAERRAAALGAGGDDQPAGGDGDAGPDAAGTVIEGVFGPAARSTPAASAGHCCIERSPRAAASTSPLKDDRSWARSSSSTLSWRPSMKESLHFAGLPRHIPAQCNSAPNPAPLPPGPGAAVG
jgi:VIT1/CCC1 family predicted Fe2+/Mn2+ transporter